MVDSKPTILVDHAALRSNQATIIAALLLAFVIDSRLLVALVAALMLVGTVLRTQAFRWIYVELLRPLRLLRPDPIPDHPQPHRFAQGLGGLFLAAGSVALALGASLVGWALV